MNQSQEINELASALSKAQTEMQSAIKDSNNPFYKSKYADLSSVWEVCRPVLGKNGLCVMQCTEYMNDKFIMVTMLAHSSGQWIKSYLPLNPAKNDSQGVGSAITYMRRYGLSALVGVVSDDDIDDDGEAASLRRAEDFKKKDEYMNKSAQSSKKDEMTLNVKPGSQKATSIEKITEDQKRQVNELLVQTDKQFIKEFIPKLNKKGFIDLNHVSVDQFEPLVSWIKTNIDKIKNTVAV